MRRIALHSLAAATAAALTFPLAACSDPAGPSVALDVGSFSVWYEAGVRDSIIAEGALHLTGGHVAAITFAAAGDNVKLPGQKLTVVGFTRLSEDRMQHGRVFAITLPGAGLTGTVPIRENCFDASCAQTLFFNGVGPDDPHRDADPDEDRACVLTQGSVTYTPGFGMRMTGRFSGTGYCMFDRRYDPLTPFRVDSARFDVPVNLIYRPRIDLY